MVGGTVPVKEGRGPVPKSLGMGTVPKSFPLNLVYVIIGLILKKERQADETHPM
jgi:hypothetical protein